MTEDTASRHLNSALIAPIIRDVAAIVPHDDLERSHQNDVVHWLQGGVKPFSSQKTRYSSETFGSYFVLIDTDHRSLLLVDHIKAQLWLPSGGHVKLNGSPWDAVVREAKEEFGIRAVPLRNDQCPFFVTTTTTVGLTPGHIDMSLWYLLRGSIHDTPRYDRNEFTDVEWYTFDEILETNPTIFGAHLQRFTTKLDEYL